MGNRQKHVTEGAKLCLVYTTTLPRRSIRLRPLAVASLANPGFHSKKRRATYDQKKYKITEKKLRKPAPADGEDRGWKNQNQPMDYGNKPGGIPLPSCIKDFG
ncbi:MAG: hypothetical protein DRI88_10465 [Bacteroidetes bacterium]|nr:MAG: hypothetical protein DRI88_10465 [Bacteroidota bacterium]